MAAKKTTRSTTTAKRTTTKKPVGAEAPSPAQPREFWLQVGNGFSLVTERIGDGQLVCGRVPAGATLEVSYWKEPAAVAAVLSSITLHARLDGATLPSAIVANRDTTGRLLRAPARLELAEGAKHLEYWFELKTTSGESLWDSNWGHNHWLELTTSEPALEVEQTARAEA